MGRDGAIGREEAAMDRDFTRKMARHLQPSVPAWDQAGPSLPWWETVAPGSSSPRGVRMEPATSGSETSDLQRTVFSRNGESGTGERGWTPMKRILMALAGLAALFLAAGANAHW
jgi:hypothetical protein